MASEVIERTMYGGQVQIVHNPNARGRQPRYLVNGVEKPKGVTTILGATLSKDLMQWAVDVCIDYLKTKIPVVTEEDLAIGADEYKRKRDSGAGTGTEAHALVEGFLKGIVPDKTAQHSKEAVNAYNAFVKWFMKENPDVINVEEVVYSMTHKFAGTYDCMLKVGDKVYLCDLKTTNASRKAPNGVYAEYFAQLGAYAAAHEEQRAYEEANGGTKLVKIDGLMVISAKKNGALHIVTNEDINLTTDKCCDIFINIVNVHNFLSTATTQLGGKM
jgi:hypothetical protein